MIFTKPYADALIVLLVILLFFGPKRLPALGKSLGTGFREFKDSITGGSKNDDSEEQRPELTAAAANPAQAQPAATVPAEPAAAAGAAAPSEQTQAPSGSTS